jgi:hypothetical protein
MLAFLFAVAALRHKCGGIDAPGVGKVYLWN